MNELILKVKVPKHMTISKPDSGGSQRIVCACGTHNNTFPDKPLATIAWIRSHIKHDTP